MPYATPDYLLISDRCIVHSMNDCEKQQAEIQLLTELAKGVNSLRREGGLTIDEAFAGLEKVL